MCKCPDIVAVPTFTSTERHTSHIQVYVPSTVAVISVKGPGTPDTPLNMQCNQQSKARKVIVVSEKALESSRAPDSVTRK